MRQSRRCFEQHEAGSLRAVHIAGVDDERGAVGEDHEGAVARAGADVVYVEVAFLPGLERRLCVGECGGGENQQCGGAKGHGQR